MIFLIASNLPFNLLIGCDILRKYSAIIDIRQAIVSLKMDNIEWTAKLVENKNVPSCNSIRKFNNNQDESWNEMCIRDRHYWAPEQPCLIHQHPLHSHRITAWCAVGSFGIIGHIFLRKMAVTVNLARYIHMLQTFFRPELAR